MKTEIIFEDDCILVCRKPAGIAVQTAGIGEADVVSELKNYLAVQNRNYKGYLGIVHRLDQPVEGLLVFAKTPQAAAHLTKQLREKSLNKDYVAVVCTSDGRENADKTDISEKGMVLKGRLENLIAKTPDNRALIWQGSFDDFKDQSSGKNKLKYKKAVLDYEMTQMSYENTEMKTDLYFARIHIETGRFHQIRAQMANAGYPILGDLKYGNDTSVIISKKLNIRNVLLCADKIEFMHPVTKQKMFFEQPPTHPLFSCGIRQIDMQA